jgi:hypothetical protein
MTDKKTNPNEPNFQWEYTIYNIQYTMVHPASTWRRLGAVWCPFGALWRRLGYVSEHKIHKKPHFQCQNSRKTCFDIEAGFSFECRWLHRYN